jgi:hypothetical protein
MQERRTTGRSAAALRLACASAALAFLTVVVSGCLSLKSNEASQTTPGKITIKAVVCASNYKHVGAPNWTDCQPGNSGKDVLFRDNIREDAMTKGFGQMLVGFRVPRGAVGPQTFASKDGTNFTLSPSYTTQLQELFAPSADQQWLGYISAVQDYDPAIAANRAGELNVELKLPPPAGGAPLATFRWRQVVGFRQGGNADAPVVCGDDAPGKYCVDSPPHGAVGDDLKTDVSDFVVLPGAGTTAYAGTTAVVPFDVRYSDGADLGTKTFALGASTELPRTTATTDARTIDAKPDTTTRATALVPIPADTPPGRYDVSLSAAIGVPAVTRTSTARIVVEPVPKPASGATPTRNGARVVFVWTPTRSGTTARSLVVKNAPANGEVAVSCHGGGCAFKTKTFKKRRAVRLTPLFRHRKLRPRTVVKIGVTGPSHISKLFTFTVRTFKPKAPKLRNAPAAKVRCVPPGTQRALPCG